MQTTRSPPFSPDTALVLSGGGARGAYAAGVVAGLVEVLGRVRFQVIAGTSVGAINAAYLAGHAHRRDLGIGSLLALWKGLELGRHLRLSRSLRRRSLLDVRPFERLVRDSVDWGVLQDNIDSGTLGALFVAALEVDSGRTAVFADLAPQTTWMPSRDPRRIPERTRIGSEHVLASAAIPGIFPARRLGRHLYVDGGLRFNTPISPVLRTGVQRLVVISPLHTEVEPQPQPLQELDTPYGSPTLADTCDRCALDRSPLLFLAGKLFHAVLLDPFAYDLQVLERFNQLLKVLDETLDTKSRARFDARCVQTRGAPYRHVDSMVFSPSQDLGRLGLEFLMKHRRELLHEGILGVLLALAARRLWKSDTDLTSYLLFDGRFTSTLIALGRQDVRDRAAEVHSFFRRPS